MKLLLFLLFAFFRIFTIASAQRLICDWDGTCDPGCYCNNDVGICLKGTPPQSPPIPTTSPAPTTTHIIETLPPPIPTEPEPETTIHVNEEPTTPLPTFPTEYQTEQEPESESETTLPFEHQQEIDATTTLLPLTFPPKPHSTSCHTSANCLSGFWCKKGKCVRKLHWPPHHIKTPSPPPHPSSQPSPKTHQLQKCTTNIECHGFRQYCNDKGYCATRLLCLACHHHRLHNVIRG